MNAQDAKRAYFNALGNPTSGVFVEFADVICDAILAECCGAEPVEAKTFEPVTETRVEVIKETR